MVLRLGAVDTTTSSAIVGMGHGGSLFDRPRLVSTGPATLVAMTRYHVFSLARIAGHSAWWVFVVSALFAGGVTWAGSDRSFIGVGFSPRRSASYTSDGDVFSDFYGYASSSYDRWTDPELWSVVAFVVVLIAAVVEAVSVRQVVPGIVTVLAPCVAFGLLVLATPGVLETVGFDTMTAMGMVLVAVAVREVWARRFAPRLRPTRV